MVALDVAVALLEDGRVIATDGFNFFDDTPSNYTIRLDTSFSEELEAWKDIASIAVLPRELEEGGSVVIGVRTMGRLYMRGIRSIRFRLGRISPPFIRLIMEAPWSA